MRLFAKFLLFTFLIASTFGRLQKPPVVCIDPGHPSEVGIGTRGKRITEVRAAWLVALKLKAELEAKGITVVITKKAEREKVLNTRRAAIANAAKADLLVRLHCDAARGSGFMTVYPDRQGTARGVKGPSKQVISWSRTAGRAFHSAAVAQLRGRLADRGLHVDAQTYIGGKQGALTGSIFSKVPVVLVEMCVLKNAEDDAFIATERGQQVMARALAAGTVGALKALGRYQG